jgi:anaerobic magnesium-protoporphyrin IX monomethyl ester cyclase
MRKKVILLAAPNDFAGNVNVARFTSLLAPPLGTLALGSYLEAHDVPVELVDVQMDFGFGLTRRAEKEVSRRVAEYLQEQQETILWIGISQLSNAAAGPTLARAIHDQLPNVPIVMGGYFPSSTYATLLRRFPFITAVVRGDGEHTALQISQCLDRGQPFLCAETPNLAWLSGGEIRETPVHPVSLDELPNLDFDLLRHGSRYQIIDLMTSRGCPFKCNYCLEDTMRPYAAHSPEWVDRQLEHLKATVPNDRIFIYDPVFGLGRKRTSKICTVLRERAFTYALESRVDVMAPDLIPHLREAGVETIFFGIESASVDTLLRMNKLPSPAQARAYLADARRVLQACFENDVTPVMGFMLGFPGDRESDMKATLAFVQELGELHNQVSREDGTRVGFVPFAFYTKVYEGTPLADQLPRSFPETKLANEPFIGEKMVLQPTPSLALETVQDYQARIARQGAYTPLALKRLWRYYSFSMETFLNDHPELTDQEGVVHVRDYLRRFPQTFSVASTLMQYDKSRD